MIILSAIIPGMESTAIKLDGWACDPGFSGFLHAKKSVMHAIIVKRMVVCFIIRVLVY